MDEQQNIPTVGCGPEIKSVVPLGTGASRGARDQANRPPLLVPSNQLPSENKLFRKWRREFSFITGYGIDLRRGSTPALPSTGLSPAKITVLY
jgi:hypothetical protein